MNPCPLCGETHPPGPIGVEGGAFAGIQFLMCPRVPSDCFYEDREFETGPRGVLHLLRDRD